MYGNELMHYGIPGMKWGRRRGSNTTSSGSVRGRKASTDSSSNNTTKGKKVDEKGEYRQGLVSKKRKYQSKNQKRQEKINSDLNTMSDKQLRDRINRMQMEQQYRKMMTPEKSAARKQVEQILINEGKNIATQMLREEIKKAMKG